MSDNTTNVQIVICGRGGQGVLFLTRLIDEVAVYAGNSVISSETHGMAMRGGSVASYIRIGSYNSPLIRAGEADILIAISEREAPLNSHLLKKKDVQKYINAKSRKKNTINATTVAEKLGSAVTANLVLLGYATAHDRFPFSFETVKSVLERISPPRVLETNVKALTEGYNLAAE